MERRRASEERVFFTARGRGNFGERFSSGVKPISRIGASAAKALGIRGERTDFPRFCPSPFLHPVPTFLFFFLSLFLLFSKSDSFPLAVSLPIRFRRVRSISRVWTRFKLGAL